MSATRKRDLRTLDWEDLPSPENRRLSDRIAGAAPGFVSRHRTRILGVAAEGIFKALKSLPATRRLVSSRAESL